MSDAFILSACRTPLGKYRGSLSSLTSTGLGAIAVREAVAWAGVALADVDEVIMGNVLSAGVGQAPARQAALGAGLPPSVAALTVNKVCGSGLKAVMLAAQGVRCGDVDVVVAGGMESMSRAPWLLARDAAAVEKELMIDSMLHDGLTCPFTDRSMGEIAESLAGRAGISREDQDRYALESHRRAIAARDGGAFANEIVPVTVNRGAEDLVVTQDEGPRGDTSLEKLAALKLSFRGDGTITAGNSSMISDGAAALVVGSDAVASRSGVRPLARIVAAATSGGEPGDVFTAPVEAIRHVIAKGGLSLSDVDLFEINEAFAVQMLACMRELGISPDRVNVRGGAIALGHPIGASGARVLVTLIHALKQRGGRHGVAALCLGGGNAVAMLVERVED
jgi:acetyl-CoA C-acetyltransferase